MSYDEMAASRVREVLSSHLGVVEKKMFGGLAFMVNGHLCCGVLHGDLMVRVGPDRYGEALAQPGARPMDFTGKPLAGYVYVARAGYASKRSIEKWVSRGVDFVATLPKKKAPGRAHRPNQRGRVVVRGGR